MAPIPVYAPEWYGAETVTDEFPLQLSGFHYRGRLHSSWGGVEILKELNCQAPWAQATVPGMTRGVTLASSSMVPNWFSTRTVSPCSMPRSRRHRHGRVPRRSRGQPA